MDSGEGSGNTSPRRNNNGKGQVDTTWLTICKHVQLTNAADLDPENAVVLANMSLCWTRLNDGVRALQDAMASVELTNYTSAKSYNMVGEACMVLKDYKKAADAFSKVLEFELGKKEIEEALRVAKAEHQKFENGILQQGFEKAFVDARICVSLDELLGFEVLVISHPNPKVMQFLRPNIVLDLYRDFSFF